MEPPSLFSRCLDLGVAPTCAGSDTGLEFHLCLSGRPRSGAFFETRPPYREFPSGSMASRPFTVTPSLSAAFRLVHQEGFLSRLLWCPDPATPLPDSRAHLVHCRDEVVFVTSGKPQFLPLHQVHYAPSIVASQGKWYPDSAVITGSNGGSPSVPTSFLLRDAPIALH